MKLMQDSWLEISESPFFAAKHLQPRSREIVTIFQLRFPEIFQPDEYGVQLFGVREVPYRQTFRANRMLCLCPLFLEMFHIHSMGLEIEITYSLKSYEQG